MIAPLLYLHEGTGAIFKPLQKMAGRLAHGHDIVDEDRRRGGIAFRFQLFDISKHAVDLGHGGIGARIDLGRTAGDDNFATGLSRRARRMACRACRSASFVTEHVLTTTMSSTPPLIVPRESLPIRRR